MTHKLNQQANDWMQCTCGKIFANSKKGKRTALQKFEEHLLDKMSESAVSIGKEKSNE